MVMRNLIAVDGPLDTPISCVFSKKLVDAIKRKGSRAEVIRELLDPDKVQDLLREDAEYLERFRRMQERN